MSTIAVSESGELDIEGYVRSKVHEWSEVCRQFPDQQHREIILGEPGAERLQAHRKALAQMIRLARMYYAAAADPENSASPVTRELRGRMRQLEESWEMLYNQMPAEEAERVLAKAFPNGPRA